jgi:hypothetical protein
MLSTGRVLLAVLACVIISACGDKPSEENATTASSESRPKKRSGTALPPEMVAAVPAGRNSNAVALHFALQASPKVGQPLPIELAIETKLPFDSVRAHFESQDGIPVGSGKDLEPKLNVDAGKFLSHTLVLQPTRAGVFMVTAAVETEGEDGNVTRIFSIPVIVGSP